MNQPSDNTHARSMEDELSSIGKSLERERRAEAGEQPWRIATLVLGVGHAAAFGWLSVSRDPQPTGALPLSSEAWGATTASVILFVCVAGFIAILIRVVLGQIGKLLKLATHLRNAIILIVTVLAWWVGMAAMLGG
jgi:hypothetical protein